MHAYICSICSNNVVKVQVGDAILSSVDNATNYEYTPHISRRLERSIVTPPVPPR